jgi:hypothetical protein
MNTEIHRHIFDPIEDAKYFNDTQFCVSSVDIVYYLGTDVPKAKKLGVDLHEAHKQIQQAYQEWDVVEVPIFQHDNSFHILHCNRAYRRNAVIFFKQIIGQLYYDVFAKTHSPLRHCQHTTGSAKVGNETDSPHLADFDQDCMRYSASATLVHESACLICPGEGRSRSCTKF